MTRTPDAVGVSLFSELPTEHQEILTKRIAVGASRAEIELFLMQAKAEGLNPFAMPPEVWLIPRRVQVNDQWVTQHVPQRSKDGALKAAKAKGIYQGHRMEHYVAGRWYEDGDEPQGAQQPDRSRCSILIPGTNVSVSYVARYREKAQYKKDGTLTDFWKRTPFEMLAKCALVGALKLLPNAGDIEIADEDFDDEGEARRVFWAWADENDLTEPAVRRALGVPPGMSLGDAVARIGGWNSARVHVEDRAAAAQGNAMTLRLRSGDDHESFVAVANAAGYDEPQALRLIHRSSEDADWPEFTLALRKTLAKQAHDDAVDATMPPHETSLAEAQRALYSDDGEPNEQSAQSHSHAGGEADHNHAEALPPSDGQAPESDADTGEHQVTDPETEPELTGSPPLPDGIRDAGELIEAGRQAFGLTPTRADAYTPGWRKSDHDAYGTIWAKWAEQAAEVTA